MGGEGWGKWLHRSVTLLFLVGLAIMNTDHLGWKVFSALSWYAKWRFYCWVGYRRTRWVCCCLYGILCLVMAGCRTLPPFASILCSWPWAQAQCVPIIQVWLLSLCLWFDHCVLHSDLSLLLPLWAPDRICSCISVFLPPHSVPLCLLWYAHLQMSLSMAFSYMVCMLSRKSFVEL